MKPSFSQYSMVSKPLNAGDPVPETFQEHLRPQFYIPTFGEDEAGEIYLCNKFRGVIFQVTATETK